ncbi:Protein SCO1/2 OS=Castellaniella defragrans OX=75697 GN=HNR28_000201 PE=3 SV=1 [Castellaniella defragrans]
MSLGGKYWSDFHAARCVGALVVLALSATLAGCGTGHKKLAWDTENVTGGLPGLHFTLTDDTGHVVHASDYTGKYVVLYFGYTHCPDVCPTTLQTMHYAFQLMGKSADAVRVLFVSVDPERDTDSALKNYTAAFDTRIIGLTGTQAQLHAATQRYHVTYSYSAPDANGDYVVQHSSAMFVFDQKGKARLLMEYQKGAKDIAHDLSQLIAQG